MTMTPLERVLAVVQGKTPDFVPVFPMLNEYAAKLLNMSELEYYKHPERLAEGQMALVKHFGYDFILAFTYLAKEAATLGATIQYHDDASPTIGGLIAKSPQDAAALAVPDFTTNPETKPLLDQITKLKELSAGEYPIVGVVTGPFSWPTLVMGNDQWLTALFMEDPEIIGQVLTKAQEFAIKWANAQIAAGAHIIALVEGSATKSVIPEDVFVQYVLPGLKKCVAEIKAPIVLLGVGGELEPYLKYLVEAGIAGVVISTDDNLENCLQFADKLLILGNLNNLEFMDYTLENIENITQKTLAAAKGKRFIYSSQYVLPQFVKEDQIKHLIAMARKYGKIN
jgi:uroporphyrinogen decarboxylase